MSTPIPHLVAGFGDPQELEPDRRADGSRDLRRLTGLLLQPLALDPFGGLRSRCGIARSGRRRGTGCCPTRSGAGSQPRSWTGPGSRPRETSRGAVGGGPACAGSHPSRGDARPAGRQAGEEPGMTSSGCGRPAGTRSGGWGCGPRLPRTAPPRSGPAAPRRSRRPGAGGTRRPGCPCAGKCARRRPGRVRSGSSSPAWSRPGCSSGSGSARSTRVRSPGTRSAWRTTPPRTAGSSGTEAGSWPPI